MMHEPNSPDGTFGQETCQGCPDWLEAVSAYLDGMLATDDEARVHAHLRGCPGCSETLVAMVPLVQTLRNLPPVAPGRDLWPDLAVALRNDPAFRTGLVVQARRVMWRRSLAGIALLGVAVVLSATWISTARRQVVVVKPTADVNAYFVQHDMFDQDQGLPTRVAPDLEVVESRHSPDR